MYDKINFVPMNEGETFQRDMGIAFVEEKYKFIVIYSDDIIVFSKSDEKHLKHLKKIFLKFRRYGLSLKPKNLKFAMQEGRLVGHIISQQGFKIDLDSVATITKINIPRNQKRIK